MVEEEVDVAVRVCLFFNPNQAVLGDEGLCLVVLAGRGLAEGGRREGEWGAGGGGQGECRVRSGCVDSSSSSAHSLEARPKTTDAGSRGCTRHGKALQPDAPPPPPRPLRPSSSALAVRCSLSLSFPSAPPPSWLILRLAGPHTSPRVVRTTRGVLHAERLGARRGRQGRR